MLHFQPPAIAFEPGDGLRRSAALARMAGIRHALSLVEPFGSGPADDNVSIGPALEQAWDQAGAARRRCFDTRGERVIAGSAAGIDALLAERRAGRVPNAAAEARIAEDIRRGLEDVSRLMLA
jgi:hypothetical protein